MMRFSICVLAAVLVCASADAAKTQEVDREAIDRLIHQLASKNKPLQISPGPFPRYSYPPEYDHEADKIVEAAEKKLKSLGKDAIPQLIEHSNDPRHSQTAVVAFVGNVEVGEVCEWIIHRIVDVSDVNGYKVRVGTDGDFHRYFDCFERYYQRAADRKPDLQKWWLENEHKSLRQIQIEIMEARIEHERKIGFPTERQRELYLTPLLEQLAKLKQ